MKIAQVGAKSSMPLAPRLKKLLDQRPADECFKSMDLTRDVGARAESIANVKEDLEGYWVKTSTGLLWGSQAAIRALKKQLL